MIEPDGRSVPDPAVSLTLPQMSDLLAEVSGRAICGNGSVAKETWLLLEAKDALGLDAVRRLVERLVPHQAAVAKMIYPKVKS